MSGDISRREWGVLGELLVFAIIMPSSPARSTKQGVVKEALWNWAVDRGLQEMKD